METPPSIHGIHHIKKPAAWLFWPDAARSAAFRPLHGLPGQAASFQQKRRAARSWSGGARLDRTIRNTPDHFSLLN
jgi:hypothetical protein